jgi:hypothetical protein
MKWLLFGTSLFALWVAFNALFMLSGPYSTFNFVVAAVGVCVGVFMAWLSSKRFVEAQPKRRRTAIMQAPPMALCFFILFLLCSMGVLKLLAYR